MRSFLLMLNNFNFNTEPWASCGSVARSTCGSERRDGDGENCRMIKEAVGEGGDKLEAVAL